MKKNDKQVKARLALAGRPSGVVADREYIQQWVADEDAAMADLEAQRKQEEEREPKHD